MSCSICTTHTVIIIIIIISSSSASLTQLVTTLADYYAIGYRRITQMYAAKSADNTEQV